MRSVAGLRSASDPGLTPAEVIERLEQLRFEPGIAIRLLTIAQEFGIKSEVVPGGGVITIMRAGRARYTITDKMVLL